MAKLLVIDVSPRGDYSVSRNLAKQFITEWTAKNAGGTVVTRDLSKEALPMVDLPWIAAAYSTPDQHTPEQQKAIGISDELIAELLAADHILIASPMFNFSLPAALKAWIDHIARLGKTFTAKYEGLVTGKQVSVIMAAGGDYKPGAYMSKMDFFSPYLAAALGFLGMTELKQYYAGDTSGISMGKTTMEAYLAEHGPAMTSTLLG